VSGATLASVAGQALFIFALAAAHHHLNLSHGAACGVNYFSENFPPE
jgi:hypothetical protein